MNPPIREVRREGMHRLIPSRYSETGTVLEEVTDDDQMLRDAAELDAATNERIQGELHGLSGITQFELVYGIPNAHIVRAAFLHPGPFGARFNDTTRGAWYAADTAKTSIAEVGYHKRRRLEEMVVPGLRGQRPDREVSAYDDWQADFHASFHALEPPHEYVEYLRPEPVPQCYADSQELARELLAQQSNGVLYPSVRFSGGTCLACFRPALVYQPRRTERYEVELRSIGNGYDTTVRIIPS